MAHSIKALPQREKRAIVPPTVTLALWRLRQVWGLLFITCIGMIAAVMLACTVPLYSLVAMSAGVRGILTAAPQNADITVFSISHKVDPTIIAQTTVKLNQELQRNLGRYINPPQFSLQSQTFPITRVIANPDGSGAYQPGGDKISVGLVGTPMEQTAAHLVLAQGRLPQDGLNTVSGKTSAGKAAPAIEIALTPETALALHVNVGSTLITSIDFINGNLQNAYRPLVLHVVGIFKLATTDDAFWHGEDFHYFQPDDFHTIYRALAANPALLTALAHLSSDPTLKDSVFQAETSVLWYYHIDTSRISINDVGNIVNSIKIVKVDNANNPDFEQSPYLQETQTFVPTDTDSASLEQYNSRTEVARLSVNSLLILIIGLLLFFVSMMVDLLIDRQADSIAILRSRGASRLQIFGALVTQGIGLALLALLVGPVLAIPMTRFLIEHSLSPSDQSALNLIASDPVQVLLGVRIYILLAVGAAILAMIIAVLRSVGLDVLTVRREAARTTRRPLWQRWNLDMVAAIVSLIGFGISLYVTSAGILDQRAALLLLSPLTVLGAVFLLVGGLLILLRFFPLLVQASSRLTVRSRGAAPLLALAQIARAPRQSIRMILLLALAIAFSIFTLVATASQAQRIFDVTSYQAGADFSGTIPVKIVTTSLLADTTTAYKHVPGVLSASLGYVKPFTAGSTREGISIDFKAVDADTFAQTAIWTPQDSSQSLDSLMRQLAAQRNTAIAQQRIPAILDASAWNALHLSPGAKFTVNVSLHDYKELINFVAVAQVQHIPTSDSEAGPGIIVDYRSFATVYRDKFGNSSNVVVPANTVWLRTVDYPGALNGIRQTLAKGDLRLQFVYDRRGLVDTLYREPLYLTLSGVLGLGAVTALLLALVGNLIASWLSVRSRLTSFTILRALGATPVQVAVALTWEQCLIYTTAVLLGILLGAIFSALAVPALTFTGTTPSGVSSSISNGAFYLAQTVPPIQIIVPPSLSIALAVFLFICIISLGLMVRVVSRPSMSQVLRLNED